MKWVHLIFDNWSGVRSNEVILADPAWEQVESAVRSLNGENRTSATFGGEDGREIVVSGGPVKFVVTVAYNDDEIFTLKDITKPDLAIELTTGGQSGNFSEQEAWEMPVVLRAISYFYEHGRQDPSLPWVKVG